MTKRQRLSRRMFLGGGIGIAGLVSNVLALSSDPQGKHGIAYASSDSPIPSNSSMANMADMPGMSSKANGSSSPDVGTLPFSTQVDPRALGNFDPMAFLTQFEMGTVMTNRGKPTRVFNIISTDENIIVGFDTNSPPNPIKFPAWAFGLSGNTRGKNSGSISVPGPTLRCFAGENILVNYTNNTSLPHGIHFHGIHDAANDGALTLVEAGKSAQYQFVAEPFGIMAYHCHVLPTTKHVGKGLYGVLIIDPPAGGPQRVPANEMVLVMNGFSTQSPDKNDIYAFNTVANFYAGNPIQVKQNQLIRVYLLSVVCLDPPLSFHLHANMFSYIPTGTALKGTQFTDMITLSLLERGILEFTFKFPGMYMFHSHDTPGEMGMFGVFKVT